MLEQIKNTVRYILSKVDFEPEIGIILGTGLGGMVESINIEYSLDYKSIPGFPISTVEGHAGRLIFGTIGNRKVVAMQGRFHFYEGYTTQQVVFPVRVMKFLGIKYLFVSNASGGINPKFSTGDLMVITDHVNLLPNPLIGSNIPELGPRFPDMSDAYDLQLIALAEKIAVNQGIKLQHGCYVGGTGPTFETPKEYGYFRCIGGDVAGMSTTPEVIAARHMGLTVFGVSVVTNMGLVGMKSTHQEVQIEGAKAGKKMTLLFVEMIKSL